MRISFAHFGNHKTPDKSHHHWVSSNKGIRTSAQKIVFIRTPRIISNHHLKRKHINDHSTARPPQITDILCE